MSKGRSILADDMGLGKTRQAIVAMQVAAPEGAILVVYKAENVASRISIRVGDVDGLERLVERLPQKLLVERH
jgi:hypothetical protein